jgi:hypothetical protein
MHCHGAHGWVGIFVPRPSTDKGGSPVTREQTLEKALRDLATEIDWLLPLDHEPNVCRADEGEECVCGSQERTLKLAELLAAADKAIAAPAPRPSEAPAPAEGRCLECQGRGWSWLNPIPNKLLPGELEAGPCRTCGGTGRAPAPGAGSAAPTREDGT